MFNETDYREILKQELKNRCDKNARYSLRAFARDLRLGSARLSEVLNGRTGLSREKAESVAQCLGFNLDEKDFFCTLVESEHARSKVHRELAKAKLAKYQNTVLHSLEIDHFKIVSDWYHFAILQLTEVQGFRSNDRWIAQSLGIQEVEVKLAIERLVRLGYLQIKRKKYIQTQHFSQVSSATPSESIRKFHRQILQKALESIDLQSIEQRELGAMLMSISKKDLPIVKEKIKKFRHEINRYTQQNQNRDSLYCLSTQLFALTYTGDKK